MLVKATAHAALCAPLLMFSMSGHAGDAPFVENGLLKFANVRVVDAPKPSDTSTPSAAGAGLRVFRDAGTGELRSPTAEEMQTAAAEPAPAAGPMTQYASPYGGVGIVLDDSFLQYSVVTRNADGTLSGACVDGPAKADAILRDPKLLKSTAKETFDVR